MSVMSEASARIEGWAAKQSERSRAKRIFDDVKATDWRRQYEIAAKNVETLYDTAQSLDELRSAIDARNAARTNWEAYNEIHSWMKTKSELAPAKTDAPSEAAVEPALAWLNEQMLELLGWVRKLDRKLGRTSSIEDAIRDDDLVKAWRDIEDAADRYEEIRQAQEEISRRTAALDGPALTDLLNHFGILRNALDHHRHWIFQRTRTYAAERGAYDRGYLDWLESPPLPVYEWEATAGRLRAAPFVAQSPLDSRAPRRADRIEVLRWLAKNNAAWVPTFAEMYSAAADITAMLAPLHTLADTRHALQAFVRYYTDRGVSPVTAFDGRAALAAMPQPRGLRDNRDSEGRVHADPRIVALIGE